MDGKLTKGHIQITNTREKDAQTHKQSEKSKFKVKKERESDISSQQSGGQTWKRMRTPAANGDLGRRVHVHTAADNGSFTAHLDNDLTTSTNI